MRKTDVTNDRELREEHRLEDQGNRKFNFYGKAAMYGIIAGFLMSFAIIGVQSLVEFPEYNAQLVQYLFFIPVLTYALYQFSLALKRKVIFQNGMMFGGVMSAIAGVAYIVINTFAYLAGMRGWQLFNMDASESFAGFLTIQVTTFFLILVAGLLWSFVAMQFLKNPGHAPELTEVTGTEDKKSKFVPASDKKKY